MPSEKPSATARRIVAGAYDTHVHVAPDVMKRLVDDVTLARRCAETGTSHAPNARSAADT